MQVLAPVAAKLASEMEAPSRAAAAATNAQRSGALNIFQAAVCCRPPNGAFFVEFSNGDGAGVLLQYKVRKPKTMETISGSDMVGACCCYCCCCCCETCKWPVLSSSPSCESCPPSSTIS